MDGCLIRGHVRPPPVGVHDVRARGELLRSGPGRLAAASTLRAGSKQPGRTAESFLPDPFSGRPGGRLYLTGDLARQLPDGTLRFLGRRDHQVKVRGHRVELGEIEAALTAHGDVREAVVRVAEAPAGGPRLVAYVVPRQAGSPAAGGPTPEVLRRHLRGRLPAVMVPSDFVLLEDLPRTPNRKVDR